MDHQVEHHGHVRTARLERAGPAGLEIKRVAGTAQYGSVRGRETLKMSNLKHFALFGSQGRQLVRLFQRCREGFFHQHMPSGAQRGEANRVVSGRRHGDHNRVGHGEKVGKVERARPRLGGDLERPLRVAIMDAGELGAHRGRQLERVIATEMPGSHNADAQGARVHEESSSRICLRGGLSEPHARRQTRRRG